MIAFRRSRVSDTACGTDRRTMVGRRAVAVGDIKDAVHTALQPAKPAMVGRRVRQSEGVTVIATPSI